MKRSEMVSLMANTLWNTEHLDVYGFMFDFKNASEEILDALEKAGMLPPANGKLKTNFTDMGVMPDHSWEPENE